ncbi:hypothetical protein R8Z57_04735 [Microbacterium sp. M3]|uniref:SAF domain-containing protein n=1 Tax=Microbacterium arthrosphaerae TaxID=792652 RepID=A0ABU4GYC9_9MICO|nr:MULTISPECIES: hypothetical protein [Microbacterium]MDW4572081.1 hypothetical protein [Microbacterium arthrosphaerae]MDW7605936.1 hypothetical protein [Microbacterium sp. M3]
MSESPDAVRAPKRRFAWLRAAGDRVPTRWFAGIATGAFLLATAAFGGLATAAPPELATLEPGEAHVTAERSLAVQRAVLIDELPDTRVLPDDGERVLVIVAEVENLWDRPLSAGSKGIGETLSIAGTDAVSAEGAARLDDATADPWLQPGVPAQIVFAWAVPDDLFAEGDEVGVTLYERSLYTGSFVTQGQTWEDPAPDAVVIVEVEDVGAGADAEETDAEG